MTFYEYNQNNSGGTFDFKEWKYTKDVIIEAADAKKADEIAKDLGLYFDGDGDCSCCGDRWSSASYGWLGDDEGTEAPALYGQPVEEYFNSPPSFYYNWMGDKPDCYVHYASGKVVAYKMQQPTQAKELGK